MSFLQNCLLVEVPPYRNQRLSTPVHVNFYVCNGKRKRSQYQRFTFVPASGKNLSFSPTSADFDDSVHKESSPGTLLPTAADVSPSSVIVTESYFEFMVWVQFQFGPELSWRPKNGVKRKHNQKYIHQTCQSRCVWSHLALIIPSYHCWVFYSYSWKLKQRMIRKVKSGRIILFFSPDRIKDQLSAHSCLLFVLLPIPALRPPHQTNEKHFFSFHMNLKARSSTLFFLLSGGLLGRNKAKLLLLC